MTTELIALAETLDAARIAANAIEATAPQDGVYGHTAQALKTTLELITGTEERAAVAYQAILDGSTATAAIDEVNALWELASREPVKPVTVPRRSLYALNTADLIGQYELAISSHAGRCTNSSPRQARIDYIVDLISARADDDDAVALEWYDSAN